MKKSPHGQSGNVLLFILIAAALLGALTMVLSRGGSSTDQSGDVERNRILASQILRYAKGLETAVDQMILNGVSENDISFENPTTVTDYTNANCTTTDCRLFDMGGAGQTYQNFPSANDGSEWIFTGAMNVGSTAGPIGTTALKTGNDIIMLLPNMNSSLCIQINRDLGVGTAGTLPTENTGIVTIPFVGAFFSAAVTLDGDPAPFELDNHRAGCFIYASSSVVYFYYVLLAR